MKVTNLSFGFYFTINQQFVHQIPTTNHRPNGHNQQTTNMNKYQIGILWVVAIVIDIAILVALCVTIGLVW